MYGTARRLVSRWWTPGLLILAVAVAYSNHFRNSFHFDDFHTVTDNPSIRTLANIPRFFADPRTFSVLPANRSWRPLVSTSLAVDYRIGNGLNPIAFHVSTFLLFLVQLAVFSSLCQRIFEEARPGGANRMAAFFASALYGLHPACAETVNYIIQRGDLFATLGVIAGLYLYIRYPGGRRYGLYLLPVAAGALSKPPALIFPLLLWLYVRLFEKENAARAAAPSLLMCAVLGTLQAAMTPATFVAGAYSAAAYRITQPYVALRYFASFFLPVSLSADTDLRALSSVFSWEAAAGLLFLAAIVAAAWRCSAIPQWRPAGFGLWWFLIALLPTALFPLAEVENGHRLFFPFAGLAMGVVWALALAGGRCLQRLPAALPVSLAAAAVALYGWGTYQRNFVWRSEESLWRDVTVKSPRNGRGLMNYGLTLMSRGEMQPALDYFERALAWTPNYPVLEINLGVVHGALQRDAEAEAHFHRAVALAPDDARPYFYYAAWLAQKGRTPEALARARTALAFDPGHAGAQALCDRLQSAAAAATESRTANFFLDQSLELYRAGRYRECIAAGMAALRLQPAMAAAYNNIAAAYVGLGMHDAAIAAAESALRLQPDFQLAKNNLAWARDEKRKQGRRTGSKSY